MVKFNSTIFRTIKDEATGANQSIGLFGKSFTELKNIVSSVKTNGLFNTSTISKSDIECINAYNDAIEANVPHQEAMEQATKGASVATAQMIKNANGNTIALDKMTLGAKVASVGLKALSIAGNIGLGLLISWGLPKLIEFIDNAHTSTKELKEQFEELKQEFSKVESELDSVNSELETTVQRLRELENKDTLTFVEQEEYDNLKRTSAELERQNALLEAQLDLKNREKNEAFVNIMNSEDDSRRSVKKVHENGRAKKNLEGKELVEFWDNETLKQLAKATNRKASAKTQEELDNIQNLIDKYSKKAMEQYDEYAKSAEGISYIPNPSTETDRQVNEWLDYINDFQDRMMIAMGSDNAKTNAFNRIVDNWQFDKTVQELQNLGKQGKVTAEMLDDPKYDEFINKLVLLGVIDSAGNLEDIALAFNHIIESVKDDNNIIDPLTITGTVNNINKKLKPALDSLVDTYTTLFSEEGYEWQPINVEEFASIKEQLDSLSEDFGINVPTEDYENFVKILSDSSTTGERAQQAFDDLASSMINNSNVVQLTDENFDVLKNSLENLGVVNATEVLEELKKIKDEVALAGYDLANMTDEEIKKFLEEQEASEETTQYLIAHLIQKNQLNAKPLDTYNDITALEKECGALKATGDLYEKVAKLKSLYYVAERNRGGSGIYDEIKKTKAEVDALLNSDYQYKFNFDGNKAKDGGSGGKDTKDTSKTFDWIETLISRIQRNITNLGKLVSATYRNWSTRNNSLAQKMAEVNKEINAQMTAYDAYMAKANSIGLSDHYKNLVMNGGLKIEDIGNEALREQIESFKEYYEKALDASDAIEDLRANLADLAKTKFDNISEQYDEQISLITHNVSMLEGFVSQSEAAGYMASEVYYKAMADKQQENIAQLQGEYSSLLSAFDEAVKNGSIEKYSEDWYNMLGSINDVELELQDATTQLIEFNQTLQQLSWEVFDRIRESVNDITTEAEFLIDILDSKDLHTDKGIITDEGLAVQGLHAVNYNTYMEQAIAYAEELRKIEAEMAKDPYDIELVDRRNELLELQQEAISSAMSEKEAIHSLWEEGYNKMLDSLDKLISKRKEALQAEKDMYDYQNSISEKTSNISSLQKQLQAYAGDNSESAKATIQKLQVSLAEAEKDLQQTEYEKYISDQEQMLDSLYDQTEQWVNQRLDNIDGLISESVDATNKNAETISNTIKETANSYGYGISDQMETIWDSANDVVCTYGDILKGTNENIANNITTGTTNVVTAINGLNGSMQTMIGELKNIATANANSIAQAQNTVVNGQNSSYGGNHSASDYTVNGGGNTGNIVGSGNNSGNDKVNTQPEKVKKWRAVVEGKDVGDRNGYDNQADAQRVIDSEINHIAELRAKNAREKAKKNGVSGSPLEQIYNNTKSSTIMDLKAKNKPQFYASGTPNAKKGWAVVGEEGNEIIIDKDGNAVLTLAPQLLNLKGGEQVINGKETSELLTSNLMPLNADQLWGNIVKTHKLPEMSKGVGGNVTYDVDKVELVLPNVKDYDSLVTEMQHDKRFERIVQSMTTDRLAGKGSLSKYKF